MNEKFKYNLQYLFDSMIRNQDICDEDVLFKGRKVALDEALYCLEVNQGTFWVLVHPYITEMYDDGRVECGYDVIDFEYVPVDYPAVLERRVWNPEEAK